MQLMCLPETFMESVSFQKVQTYTDSEGQIRTLSDDNGQPIYDLPVNILADIQRRVVSDFRPEAKENRKVLYKIFTNTTLREDDKVDGKKITLILDFGQYEAE